MLFLWDINNETRLGLSTISCLLIVAYLGYRNDALIIFVAPGSHNLVLVGDKAGPANRLISSFLGQPLVTLLGAYLRLGHVEDLLLPVAVDCLVVFIV